MNSDRLINKKCHFDRARDGLGNGAKEKSFLLRTVENAYRWTLRQQQLGGKDFSLVPRSNDKLVNLATLLYKVAYL